MSCVRLFSVLGTRNFSVGPVAVKKSNQMFCRFRKLSIRVIESFGGDRITTKEAVLQM